MSETELNEENQAKELKAEENIEEQESMTPESEETESSSFVKSEEDALKDHKHKHKKDNKAEKLEEELATLNDKYLRLYSEFDNFRKRTLRENIEWKKTASADVIVSLLPVVDDLERAIKAFDEGNHAPSAYHDGLILILNKFLSILSQLGLEPIQSLGEDFNTDFHEAVTMIPAPDPEKKGKVLDEILKGYTLNGKVIRYSKVVVGN